MILVLDARFGVVGRGVQPTGPGEEADDAADLVVDVCFVHVAPLDRRLELPLAPEPSRSRHLEIEPVHRRGDGLLDRAPVRHDEPLESPLVLQDIDEELLVSTGVVTVDEVVGTHDRLDVGLFHGGLERRHVDLAEAALVNVDVDRVPLELLVVRDVVLHAGADTVGLHALDEGHADARAQLRIFAVALEVTATPRRTMEVHRRREQDIDFAVLTLLADRPGHRPDELGVPRGRQRARPRDHETRSLRPTAHADGTVAHAPVGNAEALAARDDPGTLTRHHPALLLERELGDEPVDVVVLSGGHGLPLA